MSKKKVIAFAIIIVGVGISLLVTSSSGRSGGSLTASTSGENTNPSLGFKSTYQPQANIFGEYKSLDTGLEGQETDNLTELVARSYAREFLKNVERGSGRVEERDLDVTTLNSIQQVLQEKVAQGFDFPEFKPEDIKNSNNNSPEGQIVYMESIDTLLRKNFSGFKKDINIALEEFFKENNPQTINYLIGHISSYVNDLLEIEAPTQWREYHLQYVNLWYKKLLMYQAILGVQTDPLKTYVVLQKLPDIIQEDLDLQSILIQQYEELNS